MTTLVFLNPKALPEQLRKNLAEPIYSGNTIFEIGGRKISLRLVKGRPAAQIERWDELPLEVWRDCLDCVSIHDSISDPDMAKKMVSGEYEVNGATATVVRSMSHHDTPYLEAYIVILADNLQAANDLHRAILFGKLPDRPYVEPSEPKVSEPSA